MRALWLVNQLWFIVPVNPWKNRASSELLYKSNRPQVSMIFLVNKPLRAAGMSADNVRGWEIVRKINIWPSSARDIISQHTSKPKRPFLFYNPSINFHIVPSTACKKPVLIRRQIGAIVESGLIWSARDLQILLVFCQHPTWFITR